MCSRGCLVRFGGACLGTASPHACELVECHRILNACNRISLAVTDTQRLFHVPLMERCCCRYYVLAEVLAGCLAGLMALPLYVGSFRPRQPVHVLLTVAHLYPGHAHLHACRKFLAADRRGSSLTAGLAGGMQGKGREHMRVIDSELQEGSEDAGKDGDQKQVVLEHFGTEVHFEDSLRLEFCVHPIIAHCIRHCIVSLGFCRKRMRRRTSACRTPSVASRPPARCGSCTRKRKTRPQAAIPRRRLASRRSRTATSSAPPSSTSSARGRRAAAARGRRAPTAAACGPAMGCQRQSNTCPCRE